MTQIRINQLEMMYPDSFHEMSEEKKTGLVFCKDSPRACLEDPENHIIVTIYYYSTSKYDTQHLILTSTTYGESEYGVRPVILLSC